LTPWGGNHTFISVREESLGNFHATHWKTSVYGWLGRFDAGGGWRHADRPSGLRSGLDAAHPKASRLERADKSRSGLLRQRGKINGGFAVRQMKSILPLMAAVVVLVLLGNAAATASPSRQVIVYYANETARTAPSSPNYQKLFEYLRNSRPDWAETVITALKTDAELYPAHVERLIGVISRATQDMETDAVIFTNDLAHKGLFRLVRSTGETLDLPAFRDLQLAPNPVLDESPLSRPEIFAEALAILTRLPETKESNLILITSSHGDETKAIIPRVTADLLRTGPQASARTSPTDEKPILWAVESGISKAAFWEILASSELSFSLILRDACRSGVGSFSEYSKIPTNVAMLAHTGSRDIKLDEIDYAALFANVSGTTPLASQLEERLAAQGIEISSPRMILTHLMTSALRRMAPFLLFLPLLAWLAFMSWPALNKAIFRQRPA
jgi:hypothetical protein